MGKLKDLKNKFKKPENRISDEVYKNVAKSIKEEHIEWSNLNDEILILLLKIAVSRYPTEEFNNITEEELKKKITGAFIYSAREYSNLGSPSDIALLNNAYLQGKKLGLTGSGFAKMIKSKLKRVDIEGIYDKSE